jgi:REP element-mobilizing transposase RayT
MSQFAFQRAYRRNLPHIQPPGATFFITFRLAGSLPQDAIRQWRLERQWLDHLARTNPTYLEQIRPDFERAWFKKFELLLDGASVGPVWLRDDKVAEIVAESLFHRDGKVYRLDAFSIMPNHVHTVIKPLPVGRQQQEMTECNLRNREEVKYHSLATIMQSLKGYTALQANRHLGHEGEFWAHESYDHWVRDNDEWQRIIAYVLNNPLKAGLVKDWRDWKWSYRRSKGN